MTYTTTPPPPPAPEGSDTDFQGTLSFVKLLDNNATMLLNGEPGYPVVLPRNLSSEKKSREDRILIVMKKIFEGCDMYYVDYISEQNVRKLAKEIVFLLYERATLQRLQERMKKKKKMVAMIMVMKAPLEQSKRSSLQSKNV
jgi:hypothetical protein